jgi:hypothetical protein
MAVGRQPSRWIAEPDVLPDLNTYASLACRDYQKSVTYDVPSR